MCPAWRETHQSQATFSSLPAVCVCALVRVCTHLCACVSQGHPRQPPGSHMASPCCAGAGSGTSLHTRNAHMHRHAHTQPPTHVCTHASKNTQAHLPVHAHTCTHARLHGRAQASGSPHTELRLPRATVMYRIKCKEIPLHPPIHSPTEHYPNTGNKAQRDSSCTPPCPLSITVIQVINHSTPHGTHWVLP